MSTVKCIITGTSIATLSSSVFASDNCWSNSPASGTTDSRNACSNEIYVVNTIKWQSMFSTVCIYIPIVIFYVFHSSIRSWNVCILECILQLLFVQQYILRTGSECMLLWSSVVWPLSMAVTINSCSLCTRKGGNNSINVHNLFQCGIIKYLHYVTKIDQAFLILLCTLTNTRRHAYLLAPGYPWCVWMRDLIMHQAQLFKRMRMPGNNIKNTWYGMCSLIWSQMCDSRDRSKVKAI